MASQRGQSAYADEFPEIPPEKWIQWLREDSFPEWGNVNGTLSDRLTAMNIDDVVAEYIDPDNLVVEIGPAEGYTSIGMCNITGADVLGIDLPAVFAGGTATNRHGPGPEPSFLGGVAPFLPVQDSVADGVAAFNSVTYLARNIGTVAADRLAAAGHVPDGRYDVAREVYVDRMVDDLLHDMARVTDDDGYALLAEQTDCSYLVLEKDSSTGWTVRDHDAHPDYLGDAFHIRYGPWVRHPSVEWAQDSARHTY
ncbi:MAG: hypothetical protein SVY41_00515 [Candidatus Nanohaloarchaea archaeon]|nr:hypothetical protein [Candidatus Nanohaloarchaea archaeon]